MANQPIPTLPVAIGLTGDEQFELVQSGISKRATSAQIGDYVAQTYPNRNISSITASSPIVAITTPPVFPEPGSTVALSIGNNSIGNINLAFMASGTVKAYTGSGSGQPTDATVSAVLDTISSTQGAVLYRGTSSWTALSPGTNGYVLTTGGSGANPSWASPNIAVVAITGGTISGVAITTSTINSSIIGGSTPAAATFTNLTATGTVSFSNPLTVPNGGTGAATLTANGIVYGNGTSAVGVTAAGTTGQALLANLGNAPTWGAVNLTTTVTGVLPAPNGGTGFSSYTTGDILYANSSNTLARLNDVQTGNALISGGVGVAPSWGKIDLTTHVSGTLPVANGGTGATTLTGYVYGNGTGAFTAALTIPNAGLTNSSLTIGSTNIALGATSLTLAGVTTVTLTQDPVSALQASTKQYVDNQVATVSNQTFHTASAAASTANLTATYSNGTAGVGATLTNSGVQAAFVIDGYTASLGDRILIKDQTTGAQNGIYTVTTLGTILTNWVLTRATDFNATGSGPNYIETGASTFVTSGTVNASTGWVLTTTGTITVGTTSLTFAQTSSSSSVTVTSPLLKTGSVISLQTVPTTLGGTGLATLTAYNVLLGNGTGNVAFAAPGTTGYPLLSTGASSNPAFGQLSLTAGVTGTLPVANGGTGTATSFTLGSVVFAGASGVYTQNNTKFFWDNTNYRLGVNTGAPNTTLSIVSNTQTAPPSTLSLPSGTDFYILGADATPTRITQDAYGTGNYSAYTGRQARGTAASPTATQTGDILVQFTGRGYYTTTTPGFSSQSIGRIDIDAAENFTDTAQGTYISLYTTALGATNPSEKFRIGPAGQFGIGGATYGASGYVFTSGGASAAPTWSQVSLSAGVTGTLPATNGGTGQSSYAVGDLLYADTTTTLAKLADIATGNVLLSGGISTAPAWGKVSLTTAISGILPLANGGTNANLTASNGGIFYSTASAGAILLGTATARQMLQSGATGAPAWSTSTWPATTTANQLLYSSSTSVVGEITTANSSVLVTNGSGAPSWSTTLPAHTVTTSVTVPLIIGGSGTTGTILTLQTTSGTGTTDTIAFTGGTNGGTTFATLAAAGLRLTSAGSSAFAVGRQGGTTGPAFSVDASTGSQTAGLKVTGAALNGTVAVSVTDTSGNTNLTIDALGSGTITLGGTSTGTITHTRATTLSAALTYGGVALSNSVTGTGSMVLSAGPTITGHPTIEGVTSTGATGTGNLVFASTPTLTTPVLGAATATSINGLTITTTTGTLTMTNAKTLAVTNSLTLSGTDSTTMTFPATSSTVLTTGNTATIAKGFTVTKGVPTANTSFTVDPTIGNYQYFATNTSYTITAYTAIDHAVDILIAHSTGTCTPTLTGFTVVTANTATPPTTSTAKWILSIRCINGIATYSVYVITV